MQRNTALIKKHRLFLRPSRYEPIFGYNDAWVMCVINIPTKRKKGDILESAPRFLESHPHIVVSLLYLDVVIYGPTKVAIETFLPRMVKRAIISFGELNSDV